MGKPESGPQFRGVPIHRKQQLESKKGRGGKRRRKKTNQKRINYGIRKHFEKKHF